MTNHELNVAELVEAEKLIYGVIQRLYSMSADARGDADSQAKIAADQSMLRAASQLISPVMREDVTPSRYAAWVKDASVSLTDAASRLGFNAPGTFKDRYARAYAAWLEEMEDWASHEFVQLQAYVLTSLSHQIWITTEYRNTGLQLILMGAQEIFGVPMDAPGAAGRALLWWRTDPYVVDKINTFYGHVAEARKDRKPLTPGE